MTEVLSTMANSHRHARSASALHMTQPLGRVPAIEMRPNPAFSFPMLPAEPSPSGGESLQESGHTRGLERCTDYVHGSAADSPVRAGRPHRRAVSTLPSFSFNAQDTSGRVVENSTPPPRTPDEDSAATPRRGHRRGASEFVGGDSRFGVSEAISTSPTKLTSLTLPTPPGPAPGRRGHAHRRSAAISSHDVTSLMQPSESQPRLSTSLPNTPMELPNFSQLQTAADRPDTTTIVQPSLFDPFGPPLQDLEQRPPSRPRVGFSDNVEYIPRPLSTISSETEGSLSTMRGHSVNNSISSMLSLSTPSPPAARALNPSLSTTFEDEPRTCTKSSMELIQRQQYSHAAVRDSLESSPAKGLGNQASDTSGPSPTLSSIPPESPIQASREQHRKKHSLGHAFGFDRRKSEPLISQKAAEFSHLSAISLPGAAIPQDSIPLPAEAAAAERRLYSRRLKAWAVSKLSRRSKPSSTNIPDALVLPQSSVSAQEPLEVLRKVESEPVIAETNLDLVFGNEAEEDQPRLSTPLQSRLSFMVPTAEPKSVRNRLDDDSDPVLDLDAAWGPFQTPLSGQRPRREMHSSRLTKDFTGPGGHYHRRAESAPALAPFESPARKQGQAIMADVFEEEDEEEHEGNVRPVSNDSVQDDNLSTGITVVDSVDNKGSTINWGIEHSGEGSTPRAPYSSWDPERLTTPTVSRRAPSLVEETIVEEAAPPDQVEIVQPFEEPRSASLTKSSSDSSETPTLLADHTESSRMSNFSGTAMTTPETFQTSAFSSPNQIHHQASFDTSRLGTSASSIADNRTMSSCATGDQGHEQRVSVDDVPSLTSSRSTMMSTAHASVSRRELSGQRRVSDRPQSLDPAVAAERRRKRSSIQSLSQLMGGSFGPRPKGLDNGRPQTAVNPDAPAKKKEHKLKKLMFWKNMSKQSLHSDPM